MRGRLEWAGLLCNVDGDGADVEFAAGSDDAYGDFSTIGD